MHAQYYKEQHPLATRYTATVPQVAKVFTVDQASAQEEQQVVQAGPQAAQGPPAVHLSPRRAGTSRVAPAKHFLHKAQEAVPGQQAAQ